MPLVFPKRQSFDSDTSGHHAATTRNISLKIVGADNSGLVDYSRDFFKLLLCSLGMFLHAGILIAVDIAELSSGCTQICLGFGLIAGLATLVGAVFSMTLHICFHLRHSTRWIRIAFIAQCVGISLDVANFLRFYSMVSFNLVDCSFNMKIVLGTPTIISVFMGIPAAFIAAAILWNLRSWLDNIALTIPVKGT